MGIIFKFTKYICEINLFLRTLQLTNRRLFFTPIGVRRVKAMNTRKTLKIRSKNLIITFEPIIIT